MTVMNDVAPVSLSLTLDDLAHAVDLPKRTVRYYIQIGLVDRPEGETRAARYGARHLEQLATIRKWTGAGVSLERIRELMAGATSTVPPRPRAPGTVEVWSHVVLADGLELTMEPGRAELSPEQVREFAAGAATLYEAIRNKGRKS
jgi:DNA-binding transcriptional MerR regulator